MLSVLKFKAQNNLCPYHSPGIRCIFNTEYREREFFFVPYLKTVTGKRLATRDVSVAVNCF